MVSYVSKIDLEQNLCSKRITSDRLELQWRQYVSNFIVMCDNYKVKHWCL